MHEYRVRRGFRHQVTIHLIWWKNLSPMGRFLFLSHAGPGVGVNDIDARDRRMKLREEFNLRSDLFRDPARVGDDLRITGITLRRRDANRRSRARASQEQGMGDIVPVAHVRKRNVL